MTSATTPKTVELYGNYIQHEALAGGAITPGMLVERTSAASDTVQAHSDAGGGGNAHFAFEYDLTGRGIDDAYAAGDQVVFRTYAPGSGVYALVAAGAVAITKGALLASAGNGTLAAAGVGDVVIAQAREAVDNSASAESARIRVEIVQASTVQA